MSFRSYDAACTALPRHAMRPSTRSVSNRLPQIEDEPKTREFFSIVLAKILQLLPFHAKSWGWGCRIWILTTTN
jgi:hypothetical protein